MKRWVLKMAIFLILAVLFHVSGHAPGVMEGIHALSPLLFLANCVTGFVMTLGAITVFFGIGMLILCVWKRRFFCRWACPLGFFQDVLRLCRSKIRKLLSIKKNIEEMNTGKESFSRKFLRKVTVFQALGRILALVTLASLIFGGFTFLFLDPIIILHGAHTLNWCRYALVGIGVTVLIFPNFWCYFMCPCGGVQEIIWRLRVFFIYSKKNEEIIEKEKISEKVTVQNPKRRAFFQGVGVVAISIGGYFLLKNTVKNTVKKVAEKASSAIMKFRLPGALPEEEFWARCTRCGACKGVCPTGLVTISSDKSEPMTYATPILDFTPKNTEDRIFCDAECTACTEICPTGALQRVKQDEKKNVRLAVCEFNYELCRRYYQMECSICLQNCPYEALTEVWSDESYSKIPVVNADLCTGCGRCVAFCPGEPLISLDDILGGDDSYSAGVESQTGELLETIIETTGFKALTLHSISE
ncbi:MAG: 4Fe-4S binding protein [Planctomycetia bacterium]|nr:4Fe-4S binding protein [Planctomycetia bacterium]